MGTPIVDRNKLARGLAALLSRPEYKQMLAQGLAQPFASATSEGAQSFPRFLRAGLLCRMSLRETLPFGQFLPSRNPVDTLTH